MEPTPWMTKAGFVILSVGGSILGSSYIVPVEEAKGWLAFAGTLLASLGAALMGQGIRRNIPTMRASGRMETLTETRAGADDQPR